MTKELVIRKKDKLTTKLDNDDYEVLSRAKVEFDGRYAIQRKLNGRKLYLHQIVMGRVDKLIDHINQDKLDNRKSNLRFADKSQNSINSKKRIDNKTGIKGVCYIKSRGVYQVDYCNKRIGSFKTIGEAIGARLGAEQCL